MPPDPEPETPEKEAKPANRTRDRLVLGLVPSNRLRERDPRTLAFARALGERLGVYVVERNVDSYEDLEHEMTLAHIDVAWLPPLVFARLERDRVAVAVAARAHTRDGYSSVLIAAADSGIRELEQIRGKRVAWVDPLSASGYVVARLGLGERGFPPPATFAVEFFAGSHAEAVRSVFEGRADVAATFAHLGPDGRVARGSWTEIGVADDAVNVLAVLGEVPLDLVAVRADVEEETREAIGRALVEGTRDEAFGGIVEGVFGARRFELGASASYRALRELLGRASDPAIGWPSAFDSTSPPGKADSG
jgi:phosphate/phosphite/phosphonate ABC transporter binding protein